MAKCSPADFVDGAESLDRVELRAKRITHFFQKRKTRIQTVVRPEGIKKALARTYGDVFRNHTMQMAAALSYYFVLSLFPALIFLSAVVAYLPVPDLFNQALGMMARFIPPDSMGLVRRVLADVITPNRGRFLCFGILGSLWAASGGFSAAIEALNIAYEVNDDRPFWKTRPLALAMKQDSTLNSRERQQPILFAVELSEGKQV